MIEKLTYIGKLSGVSSPLLPLLYAGFKYPTTDVDGVYIQTDDEETQAFISVKNNCAVVCVVNKNYIAEELNSFLSFLHIEEVLSDFDSGDGYKKIPLLMATTEAFDTAELDVASPLWKMSQYKSLHRLLSDENQCFDTWFTDFSRRVNEGVAFAVCDKAYVSCATAPCVCGECGIIAGVFTDSEYRGQGRAQKCVKGLLGILKDNGVEKAYLWCNEDKVKFYEKSGFRVIGSLYIREEF